MQSKEVDQLSAGAAIFSKLKSLGVDYVFANSGTDFPPIIEGLLAAQRQGVDLPEAITVPHEHAAVSMAHGYYQISGRAQAVMLHTNVGLSNGATAAINASCDQIPMMLMSGKTPVTEHSRFGARTVPIGWGQEMFDQTALVREATKWDYELRFPEQVAETFDRGWAIANSTPKGPVYLSLPRETLCEPTPNDGLDEPSRMAPAHSSPSQDALRAAADLIANAKSPLFIAQRGAGGQKGFDQLTQFLDDWAIPLSHYWANQISVPMSHPMQIGVDPMPFLAEADVILVLNALAPWWPDKMQPRADAKIIHLGPDPLFGRTPIRNFRADISLCGETEAALLALIGEVNHHLKDQSLIETRRQSIARHASKVREAARTNAQNGRTGEMTKEWVSHCLGLAIKGKNASVFHELGCPLEPLAPEEHLNYFQEPHSGGLGWGFGAALGAQLADRDRLIFATMGDGSYMFSNPTACHQVAEALGLPVIVLVLNNEEWGAVRHSVQGLYPDGLSAKANRVPLTALEPSPDFALTARASRAHAENIENGDDLPAALERAIKIATDEKRHVLLNIKVARS